MTDLEWIWWMSSPPPQVRSWGFYQKAWMSDSLLEANPRIHKEDYLRNKQWWKQKYFLFCQVSHQPNSLYPSDYEVSEYSLAWISPVFCSLPVLSLSPRPFPQRSSSRPLLTMALRPLSFKDSESSWKISCEWWLFTLRPINKKKKS